MADRKLTNINGAIGEATALLELLKTGAAVNHLTADDSGWDLHLHLPTEPLTRPYEALDGGDRWTLGGLVVHVQVKSRRSGRTVKVNADTLRGWWAGSRIGTPTFVLLVGGRAKNAPLAYVIRPHELDTYTDNGRPTVPDARGNVSVTATAVFDHRSFSFLAHLWARYGPLMAVIAEDIENVVQDVSGEKGKTAFLALVTKLAAPAIELRCPNVKMPSYMTEVESAVATVTDPFRGAFSAPLIGNEQDFTASVEDAIPKFGELLQPGPVKPWMVSPLADSETISSDLGVVCSLIKRYVDECTRA